MKQELLDLINKAPCYVEARFHRRSSLSILAQKGRLDVANQSVVSGVGIRVLLDGAWGFACTSDISSHALRRSLDKAIACARTVAKNANSRKTKKTSQIKLVGGSLATQDWSSPGFQEVVSMSLADKFSQVIDLEKQLAQNSSQIQSARCKYSELIEEKTIVTSDGARASLSLAQPEFNLYAVAAEGEEFSSSYQAAAVNGNWQCLFQHPSLQDAINRTGKLAVDLLKAGHADGGKKTVILSPSLVGLLCHEAIGHTVEADFVKSGSVAQGMISKRVGSELVNIVDSGLSPYHSYAAGTLPFDDEGVPTKTVNIIEKGILKSYLHNRETAQEFGVEATGNARAWLYHDEPLIRMRNTYFLPGQDSIEEMIASVDDGYLLEGAASGQADSNGEFMFGTSHGWVIKKGKKSKLIREVTVSGIAFDVLKTVDAVSSDFEWDLGSGYCGKGQPAKVDAGGPFIKCKLNIGGRDGSND